MARRRRIVFTIAAVLIGLVAAFILGDVFVLWWDLAAGHRPTGQAIPWTRLDDPPINDESPGGLRLRRFLDAEIRDPISGRVVRIRTNQFGFRGPMIEPKAAGELRILALGDSITLSSYTDEDESYPNQLEALLEADGRDLSVINAGMRGASVRESLLILTESGIFTQPDIVIMGLFLNDANRSRMIPLPTGLFAYSAIARRLRESALMNELSDDARQRWADYAGKSYPEGPFADGAWRTDKEAFEAEVARAAADWGFAWFEAAWKEMRPDLELMRGLCEKQGITLVVVLFPVMQQVEAEFVDDTPQRFFEAMMTEMNLPRLDLLPPMRRAYHEIDRSLAYDHCHLTPEGNALVAEWVAEFLRPFLTCPATTTTQRSRLD